ncbi:UBIQUITIN THIOLESTERASE PROTEIN OTUB [Salix koriyanagi]|uniref:UBIQUITIN THIOLESTERASE PROTEIN OTUB n=1 Tax=Salix koriyanagi TaxID=2511006 RepID=A0A9Q0PW71_9ROSI|nr:UBIQUITIN THIOLESTERASE PROTEIN OTUB [Salix koriyanagi]
MQNQEGQLAADGETEVTCGIEDWANFGGGGDGDVMQQQSSVPFVGDKEPLSALAAEYQSGSPILLQKIEMLGDKYVAIRRTRGDGNCFFRSFMFSYLEHILEKQDRVEVDRIKANVEECRKTLQSLGYVDFTFEDFFALFLEQLDDVLQGNETSISHEELLNRSREQSVSDYGEFLFCLSFASQQWNLWVKKVTMCTLLHYPMHWVYQFVLYTSTAALVMQCYWCWF